MTATKKPAAKAATKETPAQREEAARQDARAAANPSRTSDGAITEPASSSEAAIEARKAAPHAPAVVGGPGTAEEADQVTPIAFAPDNAPANPAAIENQRTLESRLRAKIVGESVAQASGVGRGTAQPGKAERRTGYRPIMTKAVEQDQEAYEEVVVRRPGRDLVFRQDAGGGIAIHWQDDSRINALAGDGPETRIDLLTAEEWAEVASLAPGGSQTAAKGQSAAEQRRGVATEGGDPGPAAPLPVRL
jgi:hypothetical protein